MAIRVTTGCWFKIRSLREQIEDIIKSDLVNDKDLEISDNKLADYRRETQSQTNAFRTKIEIFEQEKQAKDLTAIAVRKEIRQDNQILQTAFFELRNQTPPKEQERLDDTWCEFFSQHGRKESKLTLDEKLEELGKTFAP